MSNKISFFLIIALLIFKIAAIYFTNFTLYGDEAQYWLWSKSPDLGYFSKPPLLAWSLLGFTSIFGDSFFSLKMFPSMVYFFISFAVYKICITLSLSRKESLICALSFFIIPAASLSSFLISTDLLLLLFWILAMNKLLEIRKNSLKLNFFLLGMFLGIAFLAKYAAVYFLLSLFFLIILDKKTRLIFTKNPIGLFLFFLSLALVLLPNIFWNLNNGWVTFSHTSDNANLKNLNLNFYEPFKFLSSQILMIGPVLFFCFIFFSRNINLDFENKFLLTFSLPIMFIVVIESFLVRANANWAAPALISIFILMFRQVFKKSTFFIKINFIFNYFVAIFLFGSILITSEAKVFDRIRGLESFANEIKEITNGKDIVISDRIVFSNISYELNDKSKNLYMPYKIGKPIKNHFQISSPFSKNYKKDFFLIGELGEVSYLLKKHQGYLIKEFLVPFSSTKLKLYEVVFK